MKLWLKNILLLTAISTVLVACSKEEDKVTLVMGEEPTLSTSTNTLELDENNAGQQAISFTFNPADYGFNAAVSYALQLGVKGTDFARASSTEIAVPKQGKSFTVEEINKELLKIIPANRTSEVEVRLKSDVSSSVPTVYSNVVDLIATPYRALIDYPSLYVAGNHQNWTPATAPKIVSKADDGYYEGFVYFSPATPEFKLVKGNDWSFGDYGSAGPGKLGNGGPNLTLANGTGFYLIKANTNDMTWSSEKTSWGIIGNAIPVTEWNSDVDMEFDAVTGIWSKTIDLQKGEMKFRANDGWDMNYGDNSPADNIPDAGGANIKIESAGNYTISLDLTVGGNYYYTVKKN